MKTLNKVQTFIFVAGGILGSAGRAGALAGRICSSGLPGRRVQQPRKSHIKDEMEHHIVPGLRLGAGDMHHLPVHRRHAEHRQRVGQLTGQRVEAPRGGEAGLLQPGQRLAVLLHLPQHTV